MSPSPDFRRVFEASPSLCLLLAPDLTIADATDAYLKATFTTRQAIVGRDMFEVFPDNHRNPDANGVANLRASLQEVLRTRLPHTMAIQRYDIRRPDAGGDEFEMRYWSPINTPVLGPSGAVEWIVHRVEDVTEFLCLQELTARNQQALEDRDKIRLMEAEIYRSAQEVLAARNAAAEASTAKTRFLAAVSHDLRQPIQAALLFMGMVPPDLPANAKEIMDRVGLCLAVLQEMLDKLLDLSRLDFGAIKPRIAAVEAGSILGKLASEFFPQAAAKGIDLAIAPCASMLRTDPVLLEQILRNLIANAIKYTPQGIVNVSWAKVGDAVELAVWDTGIGIPDDQIKNIFEDFYQVDNPDRDRSRGMGIGLGTVAKSAQMLGHELIVQSRPGEGSIFSIVVPSAGTGSAPALRH